MPPTDRLLIQVVSQLKPERCGVSDHAILLAQELEAAFGIRSAFVVLNSSETCSSQIPQVHCLPSQLLEACGSLSAGRSSAILIHFSGYGFSTDGAPFPLAEAIERVRATGRFPIGVNFHELFASGMPWRSAFWHKRRQQQVIRRLAKVSDLVVTNSGHHMHWLEHEAIQCGMTQLRQLPMLSNVGETPELPPMNARRPTMVVFGLPATRRRAYRRLSSLGNLLHALGVEEILDAGQDFGVPQILCGINVRRMGVLPAADLAGILSKSTFGFAQHESFALAKSGVFAGFCAFGAIPVVPKSFAGEVDGLMDGVHLLSPGTVKSALPGGMERCSAAAWNWYSDHRLHQHASIYAQLLIEPPAGMSRDSLRASRSFTV
jgi:hypothetical protein